MKALIRQAKKVPEKAASVEQDAKICEQISLPSSVPPLLRDQHRLGDIPSVYLLENWLPIETEKEILGNLRAHSRDFVQLRGKRTARFGGDVGPPYIPEVLPPWLDQLCGAVASTGAFPSQIRPNHVFVNHYQPGEGIMAHKDGPAYDPFVAILSLGAGTVFDFWHNVVDASGRGAAPALSLVVPPRSLLIFEEEAYHDHLHGIVDRRQDALQSSLANWDPNRQAAWMADGWLGKQLDSTKDDCRALNRGERYSLTIRHVPLETPEGC